MGRVLCAIAFFITMSCSAQNETASITAKLEYRIETALFSKVALPPGTSLHFGLRSASEMPGFDKIEVRYSTRSGDTGSIPLLISKDNTKIAQFLLYDISADPPAIGDTNNRPSQGGSTEASVTIVVFDDLECPFCAQLYTEIPDLLAHYKNKVRIVYYNFPLEGHIWAMHAAIDVDCLGSQSSAAYWAAIDNIHGQLSQYADNNESLLQTKAKLDDEVRKQGRVFNLNLSKLNYCIAQQDKTAQIANIAFGQQLGVDSTPTLFINGLKIKGALSLTYIYTIVDQALRATNVPTPVPYSETSSPTKEQPIVH